MIGFCNDFILTTLVKAKICYWITQNQIGIDFLQITDGQKVSKPDCWIAALQEYHKLVAMRKV